MKVAIIASGPSLHADDIAIIRQDGCYTIAVNSSWQYARFCDAIFAGDASWWNSYGDLVDVPAERWCCVDSLRRHKTRVFKGMGSWNSGANAILLALNEKGAKHIVLTGFDCSLRNGVHAHPDHTKTPNPTAVIVKRWHDQFWQVANIAKTMGVPLFNASRYTEITSIQRLTLTEALNGGQSAGQRKRAV